MHSESPQLFRRKFEKCLGKGREGAQEDSSQNQFVLEASRGGLAAGY
jgi:hypothetical protein